MSETRQMKMVLEEANQAITRGDFEGFLKFCTDDTEWTFVGDRTLRGKEDVLQYMKTAYKVIPTFSIHHMIAEGDLLTAIGEITLTDEHGKATHYRVCDVWRFQDGKMAELQAYVVETP